MNSEDMKLEAAKEDYSRSIEMRTPSMMLRPRLAIDGNQWCALYGENLQDGVAGFGESPELAFLDFDKQWVKKLEGEE